MKHLLPNAEILNNIFVNNYVLGKCRQNLIDEKKEKRGLCQQNIES